MQAEEKPVSYGRKELYKDLLNGSTTANCLPFREALLSPKLCELLQQEGFQSEAKKLQCPHMLRFILIFVWKNCKSWDLFFTLNDEGQPWTIHISNLARLLLMSSPATNPVDPITGSSFWNSKLVLKTGECEQYDMVSYSFWHNDRKPEYNETMTNKSLRKPKDFSLFCTEDACGILRKCRELKIQLRYLDDRCFLECTDRKTLHQMNKLICALG